MNWNKVFEKGWKGIIPAVVGYLAAQAPSLPDWLVSLVPEHYAQMTIAGIIAGLVTAGANWLKHKV